MALTVVDDRNIFNLSIDPSQGFTDGSAITVLIQGNTKILNKLGDPLPESFIEPGIILSVDGELEVSENDPALLLANLIVIDTGSTSTEKLSGVIGLIPDEACGFALLGVEGDRSVTVGLETVILRVSDSDDSGISEMILLEDLMPDDQLDVFGQFTNEGCFSSEIILVFD